MQREAELELVVLRTHKVKKEGGGEVEGGDKAEEKEMQLVEFLRATVCGRGEMVK